MSSNRNGAYPSSIYSHKSSLSFQNYQPDYRPYKSPPDLKKMTSFNSLSSIDNNQYLSDYNKYPTATSLKTIPAPIQTKCNHNENEDLFKNLLLIAVQNKWSEKDVNANWIQISQIIKKGFQGKKQQLKKAVNRIVARNKGRSKSQERIKTNHFVFDKIKSDTIGYHNNHYPSLNKHHSLGPTNSSNPYDSYNTISNTNTIRKALKHKSKSVEQPQKYIKKNNQPNTHQKQQTLIKFAQDIESILCESQRRLY